MFKKKQASKRARQESTSSDPQVDEADIARRRLEIAGWRIATERGIDLPRASKYSKYTSLTNELGWGRFVRQPVTPCIPIVIEFYANLHLAENDRVEVFGHPVSYSSNAINALYGLENFEYRDPYMKLTQDLLPLPVTDFEIHHTLSLGKGVKIKAGTDNTLLTNGLSEEAQFWRKFISGRVLGVTSDGECSKPIQQLLYVVLLGQKFDVGKFVSDEIDKTRKTLKNNKFGHLSLGYPSIITQLCLNAGVRKPHGAPERGISKALDANAIPASDFAKMSTREFHQRFWAGKGNPAWQRPVWDANFVPPPPEPVPADAEAAEEQEEEAAAAPALFTVTQEAWDGMRSDYQAIRTDVNTLQTDYHAMRADVNTIATQMQEMSTFRDECRSFFLNFNQRFPPPGPQ